MVTISKQSAGILYVLTILRGVGPALQPWESILENHRKNQLIIHIAIVATSWPYDKSNPLEAYGTAESRSKHENLVVQLGLARILSAAEAKLRR